VSFSKRHTFTPCWEECWICRESQDARQQEAARVTQVANGQPALAQDPVVELEGEAAALYAELQTRIGEETHVGEWLQVTQALINQFATVTGDHQWIHTDPERAAAESPSRPPLPTAS
jgi:acyl dehydratase